jgi:hypothetical protein
VFMSDNNNVSKATKKGRWAKAPEVAVCPACGCAGSVQSAELVWTSWLVLVGDGCVEYGTHELGDTVEQQYDCGACGAEFLDVDDIVSATLVTVASV